MMFRVLWRFIVSSNTDTSIKYFSGQLTDKFETRDGKRLDDDIFSADQESLLPTQKWVVVSGQRIEVPGSIIGRVKVDSPVTLAVEVGKDSRWERVIDMFVGIRQNSRSIAERNRQLAAERRAKVETNRLRHERQNETRTAGETDRVLSLLQGWGLSCHTVQLPFSDSIFPRSLISPMKYGWIEIENSPIQYLRVLTQDCIQYWIPDPRIEPEGPHVEVWNRSYRVWSTGMYDVAYDLNRENCIFVDYMNKSIDVAKSESLAAALEKFAFKSMNRNVTELQNHPTAGYWQINRYLSGTHSDWERYEELAAELLSLDLSD